MKHNISINIRKLLSAALCIALLAGAWGLPGEALAATGEITVTPLSTTVRESGGKIEVAVSILNGTSYPWNITAILADSAGAVIDVTPPAAASVPVGSSTVTFTASVANSGNSTGNFSFYFNRIDESTKQSVKYEYNNADYAVCSGVTIKRTEIATSGGVEAPEAEEDKEFKLRLTNTDAMGYCVPTPSGDYGEYITVRLPITCVKGGVYDIRLSPVMDGDVEKFPFDIDMVDYTLSHPGYLGQGGLVEFRYDWRLSEKATVGVKKVDFTLSYREHDGELKTGTISLFVNVEKGLTAASGDAEASVPRLIIESYRFSSDKIYAGETFEVEFTVRNTSSAETVQNVQIRVKDAGTTATVVPASGGSNTVYIDRIGKGDTSTQKLSFQTAPDAEAKAYTLNLDFSYEAASTNAAHTAAESVAVPILQKIRLKCDDPVVYDEMGWLGQSCSMYVKMYNMGRSTIYNCMVDVEGQGLEMEESYFGGNLNGGATLSADFSIIPSVAGDIAGEIIISYEDVYGEPGEERLPFNLYVEDMSAMMEDPMMGEDMMVTVEPEPETGGMPVWGWIAIGAAALGGGAFALIKFRRGRRRRRLEDDI